jgi:hypothetical protein
MASNKRRRLKRRRSSEQELWEILKRPRPDPEPKKMRAWYKQEKKFGRIYRGDAYLAWLEQEFGPIENVDPAWLTLTTEPSSG